MNWEQIGQQVIVSGIVSGIVVFLFQQWVSFRLKRAEKKIDKNIKFQHQNYDATIQGFKEVSKSLLELEEFIRINIPKELENGSYAPESWSKVFETQAIIRQNSFALPENLYQSSLNVLNNFADEANRLASYLLEIQAQKKENAEIDMNNFRSEVDHKMNAMYNSYRSNVDKLREDFRRMSKEILMED